jgi:hypothetical protein
VTTPGAKRPLSDDPDDRALRYVDRVVTARIAIIARRNAGQELVIRCLPGWLVGR